jgi:hypothetical protein
MARDATVDPRTRLEHEPDPFHTGFWRNGLVVEAMPEPLTNPFWDGYLHVRSWSVVSTSPARRSTFTSTGSAGTRQRRRQLVTLSTG